MSHSKSFLCAALAVLLLTPPAHAVPKLALSIDDGIHPAILLSDNIHDGSLGFVGTLGNFAINLAATGVGSLNPLVGGAIDLNAINISSTAGGTLTLMLTESNLRKPTGLFQSTIDGLLGTRTTAMSMLNLERYIDTSNTAFGTATLLSSQRIWGRGLPVAIDTSSPAAVSGAYSETLVVTLRLSAGSSTSFDAQLDPLPEPASMALLGAGIMFAVLIHRRKPVPLR